MRVVPQLHRRIAILFSSLAGAVLLFACLLAFGFSVMQARQAYIQLFQSHVSSAASMVEGKAAINLVNLYQYGQSNGVELALYENGKSLATAAPLQPMNALALQAAERVFAQAIEEESAMDVQQFDGMLGAYTTVDLMGGRLGILLVQQSTNLHRSYLRAGVLLSGVFVLAMGLLALASRMLARYAARPMQEAYTRQLEFAAAAGHDLRTPVAVIKSSAQLIEHDPETAKPNAQTIVAEADRMAGLVNDLLLLSTGRADILQVHLDKTDAEALLIECYDRFAPLAAEKDYELLLQLPNELLPHVSADKDRVLQILGTFISNAIAYSTPRTTIELTACVKKRDIQVTVVDHGPGVEDEHKAKVFEQFYRATASRGDKGHYGLGLAVAHKLAETQGMKLFLADTPGGGATFGLQIPKNYAEIKKDPGRPAGEETDKQGYDGERNKS